LLQSCEDFPQLQERYHHNYYVCQFPINELDIEFSIRGLEMASDCRHSSVKKGQRNGLEPAKPRGRHHTLQNDSEADIVAWIRHQAARSQPYTIYENRTDVLHCRADKFGEAITREWVDSFLLRHQDDSVEKVSKLHDNARLQGLREFPVEMISK
jgi:hypothetical protein